MNLIYIANSRIPTEKAHGFQIMKMGEAFSNAGINVELWLPRRFNPIKESPFEYYGIRETFIIKKIPVIDLIPLSQFLGSLANFVESLSFAISALFYLYRNGLTRIEERIYTDTERIYTDQNPRKSENIIYSRDQFILWFLSFSNRKFVYEIHTFPKKPKFHKRIFCQKNSKTIK